MPRNRNGRFPVSLGRLQSLIQYQRVGAVEPALLSNDAIGGLYKRPFQEQIGILRNSPLPSLTARAVHDWDQPGVAGHVRSRWKPVDVANSSKIVAPKIRPMPGTVLSKRISFNGPTCLSICFSRSPT